MSDPVQTFAEAHGDRYEVLERIGAGGTATVLLAHDRRHDREVAVKILRAELARGVGVERFQQEIRVAAGLVHPNILPVFDSGRVGDAPFYVTPFVPGATLRQVLDREVQLPLERTLQILDDLVEALSYAHASGIVHRDIKPENILLEEGRAVVADFGIAVAFQGTVDERLTDTGVALGTPLYMSPEQATGAGPIDARTDVYALACLIYEMLAGDPPFTGPNAQSVLARKVAAEIPDLAVVRPELPERLQPVLRRALSPSPADRHATVEEFGSALRDAAAKRPQLARRVAYSAIAVVLLVAIGSTVPSLLGSRPLSGDRVVVAPFDNRSEDAGLDRLGNVAAYAITEGLQRAGMLEVVPTETALQIWRGGDDSTAIDSRDDPIRDMALEARAGAVVTGSYYVSRDSLHLEAQISDARGWPGLPLLGSIDIRLRDAIETVSVPVERSLEGVTQIGKRVSGAFAVSSAETARELLGGEPAAPTYEAYAAFMEGLEAYVRNDFRDAIPRFLEARRLDPDFTAPLVYAALNYWNLREYAVSDSLLDEAWERRETLSDYHRRWIEYRRALLAQDRPRALRAVRALADAAPGSKAVYNYGIEAWENGYLEEALEALTRLTPERGTMRGFVPYWGARALIEHQLGRHSASLETARSARELYPDLLWPLAWELGTLVALDRVDEARRRALELTSRARDAQGRSPGQVLVEVAEEALAHGHVELAESLWSAAADWFEGREDALSDSERLAHASALIALGRTDRARDIVSGLRRQEPRNVFYLGHAGLAAAAGGDEAAAAAIVDTLAELDQPYLFGRHTYYRGLIAARSGRRERAVSLLHTAFTQGQAYSIWIHRSPYLRDLRDYRPFVELTRPRR